MRGMMVASSDRHHKKGKGFDLLMVCPCEAWIKFIAFSVFVSQALPVLLMVEMYCPL